MTIEIITGLLNQFAFPVVCTIFLFWYIVQKDKENKTTITLMEDRHHEEINGLKDAITANTVMLEKIAERLDK